MLISDSSNATSFSVVSILIGLGIVAGTRPSSTLSSVFLASRSTLAIA
jgi:hypothetical protein